MPVRLLLIASLAISCPLVARAEAEPVLERCLVSLVEEAKVPAREPGVLVMLAVREGDLVRALLRHLAVVLLAGFSFCVAARGCALGLLGLFVNRRSMK